jgi:hypothetical protein
MHITPVTLFAMHITLAICHTLVLLMLLVTNWYKTALSKAVICRSVIYIYMLEVVQEYTKSAEIMVLSAVYKQVLWVLTEKYKQCWHNGTHCTVQTGIKLWYLLRYMNSADIMELTALYKQV